MMRASHVIDLWDKAGASTSVDGIDPRPGRANASNELKLVDRARATLDPAVHMLIAAGVSADAVTGASLALGAFAGVLVAGGHFGAAAFAIGLASIGDALDGAIARARGTASPCGAIFDAAVDRYEEFFFLAGLAFLFRFEEAKLALVLVAMIGSFMVSYGSAKAEACRVAVPPSRMRRAGRAICLVAGTALVPIACILADRGWLPMWSRQAPIVIALALVGLVANVSAVMRLRAIGRAAHEAA